MLRKNKPKQTKENMPRPAPRARKAFVASLSLAVAGTVFSSFYPRPLDNTNQQAEQAAYERNTGLRNIISNSEFVKTNYSYNVPDSIGTLVYIGQEHKSLFKKASESEQAHIARVQKDIWGIAQDFMKNYPKTHLLREGFTEVTKINPSRDRALESKLNKPEEVFFYEQGADGRMILERNVSPHWSVTKKLLNRFALEFIRLSLLYGNDSSKVDSQIAASPVTRELEDFVVQRAYDVMTAEKTDFVLAIYGNNHEIRDNLARWNKNNPSKKMSLIYVLPKNIN